MSNNKHSILIVSDDSSFAEAVTGFFSASGDAVENEKSNFQKINGKAADLAFRKDVVLFEATPDDKPEMSALERLLEKRDGETVFLGLTDREMSIGEARKLRQIGVDDVLPLSITSEELGDVIDDMLGKRRKVVPASPAAQQECTTISIAQARGGVGSTTVAVNTALKLLGTKGTFKSKPTHKVALLDFDLQFGNANVLLDLEDNGGFERLIDEGIEPDFQYLQGIMQTHPSGLDILNAPNAVVPLSSVDPATIGSMIEQLQKHYDYVVIDLPRALVDWLEPVIERTSRLQIVTDTSIPSIRHTKRLMDFYREAQIGLPVDLIVSRETKRLMKSPQQKEAESVLEQGFSHWLPDDPKSSRKAVDLGQPIVESAPRSPLGRALTKLAHSTATSGSQRAATKR